MRRIIMTIATLIGSSGIALASDAGDFWSGFFWSLLNFIADSGGIWQL